MYFEGEELNITPTADESYHIPDIVDDGGFSVNETKTTAKLAVYLLKDDGMHLNLLDEIEELFQSLEGKSGDNLNQYLWLSLLDGTDVTRY